MSGCGDLCTAQQCQILEQKIDQLWDYVHYLEDRLGALEQAHELLEAAFESHEQQDIPQAHNYQPQVDVALAITGSNSGENGLKVFVKVDDQSDSETITLPKYEPEVDVSLAANSEDNSLKVFVAVGDKNDSETITLPKPEEPEVTVGVFDFGNNEFGISVQVGSKQAQDDFKITLSEQHVKSNLKLDGSFQSEVLTLSVADGESQDTATILIPLPEIPEAEKHVKSNLRLNGSFQSEVLTLTVADGESQDTATISIPLPEIPKYEPQVRVDSDIYKGKLAISVLVDDASGITIIDLPKYEPQVQVDADIYKGKLAISVLVDDASGIAIIDLPIEQHKKSNLRLDGSFQSDVLTLTVTDGESQDTATITIILPDMNCDNLEQGLKDCCEQLTNLISGRFNNLDNQLANLENAINVEIKQVYDEITVDITGLVDTDYACGFEYENGKPKPGYPTASSSEITYTGKGFKGINESLQIVNANLRRMFDSVCESVQPPATLSFDDLYQYCDDSGIERTDYPEGNAGKLAYENAIKAYLDSLLSESKYASLINSVNDNIILSAPQYWATNFLADFSLIQSKINNRKLCNLNKKEETDVVSIVASPKYVTNVEGKVLILHFVTLDNYPKRSRGSNYRQIQIPGAKETYNWDVDFLNLTWLQGNQYAELELNEYRAKVSGWFASKGAADTFFDKVLNLTIGTEKNRRYPEQKYSRTDIAIADTRPYRAFIESINESGQAICHVKYVPPKPEDA
jgi:hypothetical protein